MHESRLLPGAVSAVGFQSVARYLERFGTYWQEFRWEPLEFVSRGDRVLVPNVFTVSDGMLRSQDVFTDRAEAEAALDER